MKFKAKPKLTPNRLRERLSFKGKACANRGVVINFTSFNDRFDYYAEDLVGVLKEWYTESRFHMRDLAIQMQSDEIYKLYLGKKPIAQFNDADFY